MVGLDGAREFDGYDEVDEDTVFHGGRVGGPEKESFKEPTGGRRRGKKSLAPARSSSRVRKRGGFGIFGGVDLRGFGDMATSILGITIGAVIVCGLLLYFTFVAHVFPPFYGALAAAMEIIILLFYIASKLLGSNQ